MAETLALIHTVAALVQYFDDTVRETLPGAALLHTLDEPLLSAIMKRGAPNAADSERLTTHIEAAREAGAAAVLVTCSTLSPCVAGIRPNVGIPVFTIDEAMFREAARRGGRIGILATHHATIEPTRNGLLRASGELEILPQVIPAAMEARSARRMEEHDCLIADAAEDLAQHCDTIVFAQASMARALPLVDPPIRPRILTSPQTAIQAVAEYFA